MVSNDKFQFNLVLYSKDGRYYCLLISLILLLKAIFFFGAGPLPDEAYYWLWSKNPAFSYYDHPPLSTWLQGLLSSFITNKQIQIRIIPLICFLIIFFLNLQWMKLIGKDHTLDKIKSSLLFVSLPLYSIFLTVSFPDALLVLLIYLSGFYFYKFIQTSLQEKIKYIYWYVSVLAFSLACITKYNAIFFGLSIFIFLILKSDFRKFLLSRHFILGVFVFLLIQSPVILWNIENEYASFNFNLNARLDFHFSVSNFFLNSTVFLLAVILAVSPVFFFGITNMKNIFVTDDLNKIFLDVCYVVLFCTLGFCFILSIFTSVLYYWATTAFILFFPFLSSVITKKSHIIISSFYGFFIMLLLLINTALFPVTTFWGKVDRETAILYGWNNISTTISHLKIENKVNQVVFTDYRLASLYSFHSEDYFSDAIMENRETQFDIWRKNKKSKEKTAIIISDKDFPIHKKILEEYSKISYLKSINVYSREKKIKTYKLYLGHS